MKCGAILTLVLLFHRSSSYGKTDGSTPLTGPTAEVGRATRLRSDARRTCHSVAGYKQGNPQTDEIGGRGVPGGVFTRPQAGAPVPLRVYEANRRVAAALRPSGLLCRRGQSNPRRSAELPEKTLIRRLDAHRIPPSPIRQRIPKPLVLAIFWLLFNRLKSNPPVGAGTHKRIEKKNSPRPKGEEKIRPRGGSREERSLRWKKSK